MDIPLYARALWTYKWLLLFGIVVAAVAAVLSGFRLVDGGLQAKAVESYSSSTTVLLTNPQSSLFQSENPGQKVPEGESAPQQRDLSATAAVYAYVVSGDTVRAATENAVGQFGAGEALTAVQRTSQPPASDATVGRWNLPIIAVIGTAATPARSQQISQAATQAFESYVAQEQDAAGVPAEQRVVIATLNAGEPVKAESSNPLIGVVAVGIGVLLVFVVLIFVLYNVRQRRRLATPTARPTSRSRRSSHAAVEDEETLQPVLAERAHSADSVNSADSADSADSASVVEDRQDEDAREAETVGSGRAG